MNYSEFRFTDGTSALEPDCSRYSNENERIISFDRAASNWKGEIDYWRLSHARHAKQSDRMMAFAISMADKSRCLHEIRTGSIKGTPLEVEDAWKFKAYGGLYTALALGTIIVAAL